MYFFEHEKILLWYIWSRNIYSPSNTSVMDLKCILNKKSGGNGVMCKWVVQCCDRTVSKDPLGIKPWVPAWWANVLTTRPRDVSLGLGATPQVTTFFPFPACQGNSGLVRFESHQSYWWFSTLTEAQLCDLVHWFTYVSSAF